MCYERRQHHSSWVEKNRSSKTSSKNVVLVIVARLLGKANETVRDAKRGSGTRLEAIGSATFRVAQCFVRFERSSEVSGRRTGAGVGMVAPCKRSERAADRVALCILGD